MTKVGTVYSLDLKTLNVSSNRLFSLFYIAGKSSAELSSKLLSLKHDLEREILSEALRVRKVFVKERNLVSSVSIAGNRRIGEAAIISKIKSRDGEPFSSDQVKEDIRSIYDMGYFDDAMVDIIDTIAGKEITFVVKERPAVKEILLTGNKELSEEKVREVVTIRINSLLDRTTLKENVELIKRLYSNNGYYLSNVESRVESKGKDGVAINFIIDEGKKVKVKRLNFIGVTAFKEKELRKSNKNEGSRLFFIYYGFRCLC